MQSWKQSFLSLLAWNIPISFKKYIYIDKRKYAEQAKWYLNGFWNEGAQQETENVWNFTQGFMKFDEKKASGNELDEFWSHKFLESIGEALTVLEVPSLHISVFDSRYLCVLLLVIQLVSCIKAIN